MAQLRQLPFCWNCSLEVQDNDTVASTVRRPFRRLNNSVPLCVYLCVFYDHCFSNFANISLFLDIVACGNIGNRVLNIFSVETIIYLWKWEEDIPMVILHGTIKIIFSLIRQIWIFAESGIQRLQMPDVKPNEFLMPISLIWRHCRSVGESYVQVLLCKILPRNQWLYWKQINAN